METKQNGQRSKGPKDTVFDWLSKDLCLSLCCFTLAHSNIFLQLFATYSVPYRHNTHILPNTLIDAEVDVQALAMSLRMQSNRPD